MNKKQLNYINKSFLVLIVLILFKSNIVFANVVILDTEAPDLTSEGAIVIDFDTGQIIYGKNEHKKLMPASTTKVMTALLTVENLKLDDIALVSDKPPLADGSSMGFLEGEEILVEDLLYSLLIHSANDAAEILAETISGSKEEFSKLMNKRAIELGALNTHFVNPSGLTEDNHYTTPYDLSLMIKELYKHNNISNICHTYSYMLPLTNKTTEENRWVANKNALMLKNSKHFYEPIVLAKTGWTPDANSSQTALAEKDGKRYIVTLMNTKKREDLWIETRQLFDWVFNEIEVYKVYEKDQEIKTLTLKDGTETKLNSSDDFYIVTDKKTKPQTILQFNENDFLKDEYKKGDVFAEAKILLNQKEIGKLDLISNQSIIRNTETVEIDQSIEEAEKGKSQKLLIVYPVIFITLILLLVRLRNKNKHKRKIKKILNKRNF
ncbi:MAG: D-alanyl-D-alanine carboxypeptidase [Clostridium sp.]|nr:D-alanyl-D-alanine carboxypeptidase [Clostridium sp.]